jgi:hypothetical protein
VRAQAWLVSGPWGMVERGHGQRGSGRDGGGGTEEVGRGEQEGKERGVPTGGPACRWLVRLRAEGGGVRELGQVGQAWGGERKGEKRATRGGGEEVGRAREIGLRERLGCWAGLLSYFLSFSFFQTNSNLFEFKSNLNSNSYALTQIKLMHQHECTTC